jgi:hypothetical protein
MRVRVTLNACASGAMIRRARVGRKGRPCRRQPVVAGQRHLQPTAKRHPVNGGHDWYVERFEPGNHLDQVWSFVCTSTELVIERQRACVRVCECEC